MWQAFALLVNPAGFKPATSRAVIWCSIQLSYGSIMLKNLKLEAIMCAPFQNRRQS